MVRKNKSIGHITKIMGILQEVYYGKYYFVVAKAIKIALFLSSLLTNWEAWYGVSKGDKRHVEASRWNTTQKHFRVFCDYTQWNAVPETQLSSNQIHLDE